MVQTNKENEVVHTTELPPFTDDGVVILTPQTILDHRWIKQGAQIIKGSLVHCKNLLTEKTTWEPTKQMLKMFSGVDLEDKDPHNRRGIDKPRWPVRPLRPNPKYLG